MHFHLTDEQIALQDAVRRFCIDRFDPATVADREGRPADAGVWRELAGLGVLGMLRPDAGAGLGPIEAALAFEEFGRHLAVGPLLWSVVSAPLVEGVAEGTVRVTGLDSPPGAGTPIVIAHGAEADLVIVAGDDGVSGFDAATLDRAVEGTPFDPLTPTVVVDRLPPGTVFGDAEQARDLRRHGVLLSAAALVGVAQGALDVARDYALERVQFDVPIGSFQAIKHLLADMFVRVELARAQTLAAAAVLADPRAGDADRTLGGAKVLAAEAGGANGRAAVQILGGMGFTWDMLPHYHLKRAWVLEHEFGTGAWHAARLGDAVGDSVRDRVGGAVGEQVAVR